MGRIAKDEMKLASCCEPAQQRRLAMRAGLVGASAGKAKTESLAWRLLHFREARGVARHQVDLDIDLAAGLPG